MTPSATRALLAVDHSRNRALLAEWLSKEHGLEVVRDVDDTPFDVAIVDAPSFHRLEAVLKGLREQERPAWLPVLLVISKRHEATLPSGAWEGADEVLASPVRRLDLSLRLERLLSLRARSVELARRLDELGRSNVDLAQFAYVAAHELATPLAVVSGAVETLTRRQRDRLEPQYRRLLDAAQVESTRLQTLIHDLLSFSQTGGSPTGELVSLDEAVAEALIALRPQVEANDAVVEREPLPSVPGDRRQLRIVFTNLIGNAIKYRSSDAAPRVRISADDREDVVTVSVDDNGRGVDPARSTTIFEMFERSDNGGTAGHGIGLALCRRIVERHGGRIWVESLHPGSSFRFELPKTRAQA